MKAFITEILILTLLTSATYTGAYLSDNNNLVDTIERVKNKDVKVINFGSSHGGAFSYSRLGFEGVSFAKAGNTLYYDLQNFRSIKDELDSGTVVLIPVSYFSFGLDENRTCDKNEAFLNDYYEYLPSEQIHDYSEVKRKSVRLFRLQTNLKRIPTNIISFFSKKEVLSQNQTTNLIDLKPKAVSKKNRQVINRLKRKAKENKSFSKKKRDLKNHAQERVQSHISEGTYIKNAAKSYKYLEQIIIECQEKNLKPFIVTTPFYSDYNNGFTPEWLYENYHKYIYKLRDQYKVPYLNYAGDDRIISHPFLFKNSDHLNFDGKLIFRRYFFSDFKEKYGELLN